MSEACMITVDGTPRSAPAGHTLASALLTLGVTAFRRDGDGGARAPVCGMGTCFECRVTVDGRPGVRACLETVREGMRVESSA